MTGGPRESALRQAIVRYCHRTYEKGYVAATDGNASARLGEDRLLITPTSCALGELTPDDLVVVDLDGQPVAEGRPTSEILMHLAIYQERPDVHAVLHAHPPVTIALSLAGESLAGCVIPEVVVGLGTIPTLDYTTPTTRDTAEAVRRAIRRRDALILERHGTVCVAESIQEAYRKLEKVEHTAHITYMAKKLGRVPELPPQEVQRLLEMRQKLGLPPVIPGCTDCGLGCR